MNKKLNTNSSITQVTKLLLTCGLLGSTLIAQGKPLQPATSTEDLAEIEQLKGEIIELNAEFRNLEEAYLYPASVDTALFVSVDTGQFFELEAIEAKVDDQPVVGHFYTPSQRQALAKGGIQRLRQFYLKPGDHQLVVTIIGQDQEGNTVKRGIVHDFTKTSSAIGLELKLTDSEKSLSIEPEIKTWDL